MASARAGNVIGGGDWSEDRLIPDCIKAIQNQETILIRSPYSTRPWQHVVEPLRGYLHLAAKMLENPTKYSEAWNFGPLDSASIPVELLVEKIIQFWGSGTYHVDNRDQPHEANLLKLDLSKSNHKLGFAPKLNIDEALKMTVDWYKNFNSRVLSPKDFTLKQIEEYISPLKVIR